MLEKSSEGWISDSTRPAFGSGINSEGGKSSFAGDGGDKDDIGLARSLKQRVCNLAEMIRRLQIGPNNVPEVLLIVLRCPF